jgi:DNA-binding MarR family transcriptional regulator
VTREKCPTDKRGWFVVMTEEGRDTIARAAPHHVDTVRRLFVDLLTRRQLETLEEIATTVLEHLPAD